MNAQLDNWTDIHFAYQVARLGTLSAAADYFDVHHSTVLRRIDGLEKKLKTKLFQRSARGYTPTEAGVLLFKVAEQTQSDFERLYGQLQGIDEQIKGTLIVTSVSSFSNVLMPIFAEFQLRYPDVKIEYIEDARVYKLEYGEAHVSVRPGATPKDPDYVAQLLARSQSALYASKTYINKHGLLESLDNIANHRFISTISPMTNVPAMAWIRRQVPEEQIHFKSIDFIGMKRAIELGMGIGPIVTWMAASSKGVVRLIDPPSEWDTQLWLVTHRDVHRTSKVQAFNSLLKEKLALLFSP